MVEVNEKTILMLVLAVLVLASLMQAFQLNAMSAALSQPQAGAGEAAVPQGSGAGRAETTAEMNERMHGSG